MKSKAQRRAHIRKRLENQELPRFPATRLEYPPAEPEREHAFSVSAGSGTCHFCGDELSVDEWVSKAGSTKYHGECHHVWWQEATKPPRAGAVRGSKEGALAGTGSKERRRQKIRERVTTKDLRGTLDAESPTWIPSPYVVGMVSATCHYCDEQIDADEALLVRDTATCHAECEEAWRDLVTGERGE